MKYNKQIVIAWMNEHGIVTPDTEYQFHSTRKWKMDFAWPRFVNPVCLEVQGGIFIQGRHSRGAALIKEWEKLNEAACMGYRVLYCQPKDLCTAEMAAIIKRALGIIENQTP